ncbi:MAG: ABC transporter ATP-binding protein, partial [Oscillospiraceae bacterium]|nr:ABC transporter ATP-binding protein [Oscillospiraceae bacterium]
AYMYADRLIAMKGGMIIADGKPSETMDADLIEKLYGVEVKVHSLRHDRIRICVPNNLNID